MIEGLCQGRKIALRTLVATFRLTPHIVSVETLLV